MSNQIVISSGAKVRNLEGVLTGTVGVVNALGINVANGIPQLDGSGKILVSQLPNSVMEYKGTWNAATNTPTLANGTGNQGDVYLCNVAGTVDFGAGPIYFVVGDQVIYSGTIWQKASGSTGTVTSVAVTESGDALSITGSPITTSGTINIGFAGTTGQYVNGAGGLTTFPSLITSIGLSMPTAFNVANSPLTANGTIAVTGAGSASQYIRGDGQLATFPTTGGGGSSIYYYLNGSISASVAGYKQMSNTAVVGAGTDFNLTSNGLIAQFLTDAGNPNRLLIPSGAWNFEVFFSSSSNGGNEKFYLELLKYNGSTFTTIASTSTNPEAITGGTTTDLYITSMAVPETTLLVTDRLAVRIYIVDNSGARTVTLHTEDNNLCQITTTFSGGISSINGLTANTQYLAVGTSGSDFNINSLTDTHTFNLPTASASVRGALSSTDWGIFNNKVGGSGTTNYIPKFTSTGVLANSSITDDGNLVEVYTTALRIKNLTGTGPMMAIQSNGVSDVGVTSLTSSSRFRNFIFSASSTSFYAGTYDGTGTSLAMIIAATGNVGIGTSSPSSFATLSLNKDGTTAYSGVNITNANSTANFFVGVGGSGVGNASLQNNAYVLNAAASALILGTSDTERMRITSAGSVGIGTTDIGTSFKVAINGGNGTTSGPLMVFQNSGTGTGNSNGFIIGNYPLDAYIYNYENANIIFGTNDAERMRITSGGNVLIGTTSYAGSNPLLEVSTQSAREGLSIKCVSGGYSPLAIRGASNENYFYVNESGNVGVGNTTFSSTRLTVTGKSTTSSDFSFVANNSANSNLFLVRNDGAVTVSGSLSKGSGSFKIDHPLELMTETHHLVHSFVESPQANNIYRGKIQLVNGKAEINLDKVSTMTEGTFVALNREIHTYTSNESDWDAVRGKVQDNILFIESIDSQSNAIISWLVIGERQDKHIMDTEWTDDNGRVIVEPLKDLLKAK